MKTPFVLGCDSSDVVLFGDPALLVDGFRRHFTCDLLFNATGSRCWPELPQYVHFESSLPMAAVARGRHWLNSGLWIGKADFCREFFTALSRERPVESYEYSDQAVIKRVWPRWYPQVQIDYLCLLFQWFNESPENLLIERPVLARQRQLLELLRPLGGRLRGAEVGVWDGCTSDALLRELPDLELWMIDPWKPFYGECRLDGLDQRTFDRIYAQAMWWTQHARDRRYVLRMESQPASRRFSDETLDFVFIDANHVFESVRADIYAWWPKVRSGGYLLGHDYGVYGDAEGRWGVRRAVDEFVSATRQQLQLGEDGVWWVRK